MSIIMDTYCVSKKVGRKEVDRGKNGQICVDSDIMREKVIYKRG